MYIKCFFLFFSMANLLSKFRIDYSCLKMVQISDKPKESSIDFFNSIISNFKDNVYEGNLNIKYLLRYLSTKIITESKISEIEKVALQEKTNRQLRLRELLLENSSNATLVVMYEDTSNSNSFYTAKIKMF